MRLKENDQRIYYSHTGNITPTWSKLTREIKISGRLCKTTKKTSCKRARQYVSSTFRLCFKGGLYAAREISDVVTLTQGFSQRIPVFFLLKSYQWRQRVRQLSALLFRVKTLGKNSLFLLSNLMNFNDVKKNLPFEQLRTCLRYMTLPQVSRELKQSNNDNNKLQERYELKKMMLYTDAIL